MIFIFGLTYYYSYYTPQAGSRHTLAFHVVKYILGVNLGFKYWENVHMFLICCSYIVHMLLTY